MNITKDLRTLRVAAIAVALAGCNTQSPENTSSGLDSLDAGPDQHEIPSHCVPIAEEPVPVLLRGPAPGAGTGGGTGAAPAVQLGAPPLQPGLGPNTADACDPASAKLPGIPAGPTVVRECFFGPADPTPQATVERVLESVDDTDLIHVRLTFNPHFVDNSYGDTAIGWANSKNGTHTFKDLVGSDHAELLFTNRQDDVALHVKLDYLSEDPSKPSGYGTLGVLGGEGEVLVGNPSHVREVATSIDRDLNGCGYGGYTVSSPQSDAAYTPNPAAPNWDFRVVYELWIAAEAFGSAGFGGVSVEYVHASPSKTGSNTIIVDEGPCPPDDPPPGGPGDPPGGPGDGGLGDPPGGPGDGGLGDPPPACPPGTVPRDPGTTPPDAGPPSCESLGGCNPVLI